MGGKKRQSERVLISVRELTRIYRIHEKEPGLKGSISSLFRRKWLEKRALAGVSFDVKEGEILGLVGANGAGKTTLVKILAGIIYPTSGDVRVLGHRPHERKYEFRKGIALIMGQKAQLWWDLPAADCFLLLKEIYRIPDSSYRTNLDYLVQSLEVGSLMKTQIRRLSLGERMKMELIAALLHNPRVVFLDEPTIGLDLMAQRAIRDFLLEYRKRHNPAMILTSHYMEDIRRLAERILIIRDGSTVYDGSLQALSRAYGHQKMITVRLDLPGDGELPFWDRRIPGELISINKEFIRVLVQRSRVSATTSALLKKYPVSDLSIEEEELENLIESILRNGVEQVNG